MKQMLSVGGAVLLVAAASSGASAQPASRLGVAGAVDYARMTDDEGLLGSGFGGAGSVQWRLTDATALEFEIGREHHLRDFGLFAVVHDAQGRIEPIPYTFRSKGNATFVLASVSHSFGSSRARPVVWGGAGLMSHGGTRSAPVVAPQVPPGFVLQAGDAETHQGPSTTALAADGGAGLEIQVARRISVRPFAGLRLVNTGNVGPKYIVRTGVRVGFRP